MTLTPGNNFPDSNKHKECGLPRSTSETRSFLKALKSTNTFDGSGLDAPFNERISNVI